MVAAHGKAQGSFNTKLQSCHCEEQSDVAIYHVEIASHSFAMTFINSSGSNATWYKKGDASSYHRSGCLMSAS